jgi:hypothetical protein
MGRLDYWLGIGARGGRFGHRTKAERVATILLPNSVASHGTDRDVMNGPVKILKQNSTVQNGRSPAETTVTELGNRCSAWDVSLRLTLGQSRREWN